MKTFSIFFFFFLSLSSSSQETDKTKVINLLKKSQQVYDDLKTYYLESTYKLYVNQNSNEIKESYNGITVKKDDVAYSKIATTELISLKDLNIKIDNSTKRIQVSKDKSKQNVMKAFDVNEYSKYFVKYKFSEVNNQYKCELSTANVSMIPYSKVVIYIDKKSNRMLKQELYFLTKHKTKIVNGKPYYDYPRLEISFTNFKVDGFDVDAFFRKENYVVASKGKYLPAKKYKEYLIVD